MAKFNIGDIVRLKDQNKYGVSYTGDMKVYAYNTSEFPVSAIGIESGFFSEGELELVFSKQIDTYYIIAENPYVANITFQTEQEAIEYLEKNAESEFNIDTEKVYILKLVKTAQYEKKIRWS